MCLFRKSKTESNSPTPIAIPDTFSASEISKRISDLPIRAKELGKCIEVTCVHQLISPFLAAFGWNISDPMHCVLEKTTNSKKRADIMLLHQGNCKIVIEAKRPGAKLTPHIKQLAGYFNNSRASIGILTDGIQYWFFSYSEHQPGQGSYMNEAPFARVSIDKVSLEGKDAFLMALCKDNFDVKNLVGYSDADYTRGKIYGLIGGACGAAVDNFVRQAFCIVNPGLPPTEIDKLISFTRHHSRWNYRHGKEDI